MTLLTVTKDTGTSIVSETAGLVHDKLTKLAQEREQTKGAKPGTVIKATL